MSSGSNLRIVVARWTVLPPSTELEPIPHTGGGGDGWDGGGFARSIPKEKIVAIAAALERGDIDREAAIERFVSLVMEGQAISAPGAAGVLAAVIASDDLVGPRFDSLFERLSRS
jgi:hypothetical protein